MTQCKGFMSFLQKKSVKNRVLADHKILLYSYTPQCVVPWENFMWSNLDILYYMYSSAKLQKLQKSETFKDFIPIPSICIKEKQQFCPILKTYKFIVGNEFLLWQSASSISVSSAEVKVINITFKHKPHRYLFILLWPLFTLKSLGK